jgi:predicted RNA-binding Zn ribbon-like protein
MVPSNKITSSGPAAACSARTAAAIALCDAPGCGQLYLRGRPNQQWCNPHCGTRARSQRHAERIGNQGNPDPRRVP